MAFTKTSTPVWTIDDTYANVAAQILAEKIEPKNILFAIDSETAGKVVLFVKKGTYP